MGVVFRARDIALDRRCAVKVIAGEYSADPVFATRFRRESRVASAVEHPNVVPVYGAGEESGRLYLVMRVIDGADLGCLLENGPLDPGRAIALLRQVAAGLDAAHDAGLVHRDVKPANILVEATPEGEHAFLTDFGISKLAGTEGEGVTATTGLTRGGQVIGTADYVAPEQVEDGNADARSDVYSLACVAFAALTGSAPFARDAELSTLIAHTKAPRPAATDLRPELPAGVDSVLRSGMAIDPAARPASAVALVDQLEDALRGRPVGDPRRTNRRRTILVIAATLLAVVALSGFLLLRGDGSSDESDAPTTAGGGAAAAEPTTSTGTVGAGPVALAVGELRLWVASRDANQIDRLRLGDVEQFDDPVPLQSPRSVTVGFGSIWVVDGKALYRLDPTEGSAPVRIAVGQAPGDVAVDDSYVWVANEDSDDVTRVDPATDEATATVEVGDEPRSIATGDGSVWVVTSGDAQLTRIDPASAAVEGDSLRVGVRPTSVAFGDDLVWVSDNAASKLLAVEPGIARTGPVGVGITIRTSASPRGVAVGLGAVWVAAGAEDVVDRFDPATGERIGRPIPVGGNPADIAIGPDAAYTADFDDATVTRIEP